MGLNAASSELMFESIGAACTADVELDADADAATSLGAYSAFNR